MSTITFRSVPSLREDAMGEVKYPELETFCTNLFEQSKQILSWSWDGGFRAVLSQFSAENKEVVVKILNSHFDSCWDSSSIGGAPAMVQKMSSDLGGIRGGQLLFATDTKQDSLAFGVFWPWDNGQTISFRIIPAVPGLPDSELDSFATTFKGWFSL